VRTSSFTHAFSLKTVVFSGELMFSGTVAGGGTTVPEFQNSTKFRKKYMFRILSPSSIQIRERNFQ
jgi:hypothetical protein